jgi:hypothetical protein
MIKVQSGERGMVEGECDYYLSRIGLIKDEF